MIFLHRLLLVDLLDLLIIQVIVLQQVVQVRLLSQLLVPLFPLLALHKHLQLLSPHHLFLLLHIVRNNNWNVDLLLQIVLSN